MAMQSGSGTHNPTKAELLCSFAYASDLAFGLQLEDGLRGCYLATRIAHELNLDEAEARAVYYCSLLKDAGCTSWTTELAEMWQADEIAARRDLLYFSEPNSVRSFMAWMTQYVARDSSALKRLSRYVRVLTESQSFFREAFGTTASVASRIAARLEMPEMVQTSLLSMFEQWNGKGAPHGLKGEEIPLVSRVVLPVFFIPPVQRASGWTAAEELVKAMSGVAFDPRVADACLTLMAEPSIREAFESPQVQQEVLALEPRGDAPAVVEEGSIDEVALAFADFVDLKSRYTAAHSRRVSKVGEHIAQLLGCEPAEVQQIRRAGLMHDLGLVAVPSLLLERPWNELSESERDQYRLHPYHGERILRRVPAFAGIADLVGSHEERQDGTGFYRGVRSPEIRLGARVIAVADRLDELVNPGPRQPALPPADALAALRQEPLDQEIVRVLTSATGQSAPRTPSPGARPAGLSDRELEVLRLMTRGLTRRQLAVELSIAENTVRHHLEHIYNKTGSTNRITATVFAMENGIHE